MTIDLLIPSEIEYLKKLTPVGTLRLSEGLTLAWLASQVKETIVEIGSRQGKSACFLASGSRRGHKVKVYSIDPWELWDRQSQSKGIADKQGFFRQTKPYSNIVKSIQGFSLEVVKKWDKPIGLLFIDGSHKLAWEDYEAWSPFIINDGIIAFHNPEWEPVRKAIEKVTKINKWHLVYRLQWARHYVELLPNCKAK